jgi:hypothetical protein
MPSFAKMDAINTAVLFGLRQDTPERKKMKFSVALFLLCLRPLVIVLSGIVYPFENIVGMHAILISAWP